MENTRRIINEIKVPTRKQENPNAQALGIYNELIVASREATKAAINEEANANA
jgi:hypothetical protein